MALYEDELIRRIKSGEPIAEIRKWFLTAMSEGPGMYYSDMSPFEQAFFNQTVEAFEAWRRQQDKLRTRH